MKKITKLLSLFLPVLFGIQHTSAQTHKQLKQARPQASGINRSVSCLYDSIQYSTWDSTASAWVYSSKDIYTYNGDGNILTDIEKEPGSADQKISYTYNANGKVTLKVTQSWSGTAWENTEEYVYTYISNNNTYTLNQTWNGSSWDSTSQIFNTFSGSNKTQYLGVHWTGSAWENRVRESFTYDGNNNIYNDIVEDWSSSGWINFSRDTYTYDANNNALTDLYEIWAGGSGWQNYGLSTYTYNSNNAVTHEQDQAWSGTAWVDEGQTNYTLCGNNACLAAAIDQNRDSSSWENAGKTDYFGCSYATAGIEESSFNTAVQVYPNPFNSQTTIAFDKEQKNATLQLRDMLGQEVKSLHFTGTQVILEKDNLKPGIYFYNVISENKPVAKGKLIIQ